MNNQRFNILMAEDNEHDIIAARRAWKKNKIANPLHIVNDGEACLDYLHQRGAFSEPGSAPPPGILLLDLNMPKMDGLTVLKRIRADETLRRLPVIVLTTSHLDEDRAQSYELGANAYIKKPIGFKSFSDAVKIITHFWELAELPE